MSITGKPELSTVFDVPDANPIHHEETSSALSIYMPAGGLDDISPPTRQFSWFIKAFARAEIFQPLPTSFLSGVSLIKRRLLHILGLPLHS